MRNVEGILRHFACAGQLADPWCVGVAERPQDQALGAERRPVHESVRLVPDRPTTLSVAPKPDRHPFDLLGWENDGFTGLERRRVGVGQVLDLASQPHGLIQ